jgi:hypothetical protein
MYWFEWCAKFNHRKGNMMPAKYIKQLLLAPDPGYSSIYGFSKEDAQTIKDSGNSSGFSRFAVFADTLYMDFDTGLEDAAMVSALLTDQGIAHSLWDSGSKGGHIHVKQVPAYAQHLPYCQKRWVMTQGFVCDLSLYQHGRILSLPGRIHPKTGRPKRLIAEEAGEPISLDLSPAPATLAFNFEPVIGLERGLLQVLGLISDPPTPGNRHMKLWSCAEALASAGMSPTTVYELLCEVNSKWPEPKSEAEVLEAVKQGYRKHPQALGATVGPGV